MTPHYRVGINGFGRIGRLLARLLCSQSELQLVHINDPALDAAQAAHLLAFDSVHGRWAHSARAEGERLILHQQPVSLSRERDYAAVAWADKVDLLVDCSGRLKSRPDIEAAGAAGLPRLLVSQPVAGIPNIVRGVNDHDAALRTAPAVSAASCTTNCLAVVASVLHESFGIERGFITTVHGLTNDQALLDQAHGDWRRGRNAGSSLIPTTSGFAQAIGRVIPALQDRLDGYAVRAPIANASLLDACLQLKLPASAEQLNAALAQAAQGRLKGLLALEERPLVSADFLGDRHSATVDARLSQSLGGQLVKVVAWYDNESGYSQRLLELARWLLKD